MPYLSKSKRNTGRKPMISLQLSQDDDATVPAPEQASEVLPDWLIRRQQNQKSRLHSLPDELIMEIICCMDGVDLWFFRQVSYRLAIICGDFEVSYEDDDAAQQRGIHLRYENQNWMSRCYERYKILYPAFAEPDRVRWDRSWLDTTTQQRLKSLKTKFFETTSAHNGESHLPLATYRYPGNRLLQQYPLRRKIKEQHERSLLCSRCLLTNNQTYRYDSPADALLNQTCDDCAGYDAHWCLHTSYLKMTTLKYSHDGREKEYESWPGSLQLCAHQTFTWPDLHNKLTEIGTISSGKESAQNKFPFVECTTCFAEFAAHGSRVKQPAVRMMKDRAHCYLLLEWALPVFKLYKGVSVTQESLRKRFDRIGETYEALLCPHMSFFEAALRESLLRSFWDTDDSHPGLRYYKSQCKWCGFRYLLKRHGENVYLQGTYTIWYNDHWRNPAGNEIEPSIGSDLALRLKDPTPLATRCRAEGISWCRTKGCYNGQKNS